MLAPAYLPLLPDGFREIKPWQFHALFLEPFTAQHAATECRRELIDRFNAWLTVFATLGLAADIWIDGSFTTHKPEPGDVDIAVVLNFAAVEALSNQAKTVFDQLFHERELVRVRYKCDVYYLDQTNEADLTAWRTTFSRDSSSLQTKGIFHLLLPAPSAVPYV